MAAEPFAKYHGLGNDFVILDRRSSGELISRQAAVKLCDRHTGIGADGVLTILPSRTPDAAARMHLYNADGSTAEMCGNGLRCVVRFILGAAAKSGHLTVDTDAGRREGWIDGAGVRVTLGEARIIEERLVVETSRGRMEGAAISMGNPHFVLRPFSGLGRDGLLALGAVLGPEIEGHAAFPDRTNVELISVTGDEIELVVFERGAGLTQACGTGAGAAAAAARRWGVVPPHGPLEVRLPGGPLLVEVPPPGAPITIAGEAVHVFDGTIELPSA